MQQTLERVGRKQTSLAVRGLAEARRRTGLDEMDAAGTRNEKMVTGSRTRLGESEGGRTFGSHIVRSLSRRLRPNTALEPKAAPLFRSTVASVRTRAVRSPVTVGGCGSAWIH